MNSLSPQSFEPAPTEADTAFVPYAQHQNAGVGVSWISSAWRLFRAKTGMWMVLMLLALMGSVLLGVITYFVPGGELVQFLLTPILMGGLMLLCDHQHRTGVFDLGLIFRPFSTHIWPLLGLGTVLAAFLVVAMLLLVGLLMAFMGTDFVMALLEQSEAAEALLAARLDSPGAMIGFVGTLYIGVFAILFVYYALFWFSPALIVLHDVPLFSALKMSLMAVKKNLLPGLVYFILISVLLFASMVPVMMTVFFVPLFILLLLLLMLVLSPLLLITVYTSYRSLFLR